MKTTDFIHDTTPEVPNPLNTTGGVLESSLGGAFPSRQQDITKGEVSGILLNISRALPPVETTRAKEQAREFQEKMELFVREVKRVRKGFGYGYEGDDYINRLSVSDSVVMEVFERILFENEGLREVYVGVIGGFSGNKEKLKKRVMKEYGGDLVYEGMKEGEYSKEEWRKIDCTGKSAKEVKDMVVEFVEFGGKGLDLFGNLLNEIFVGEPKLFKEMVVEFAKYGGKGLNLKFTGLATIFLGKPELFKDMIMEFTMNGGKWLGLGGNGLIEIYTGKPELFKDMVVKFAKFGGKGLELRINWTSEILDSTIEVGLLNTRRTVREIIEETCKTYGVTIELDK